MRRRDREPIVPSRERRPGDPTAEYPSIEIEGQGGLTRTSAGELEIAGPVEIVLDPDAGDERLELHLDGTFITSAVIGLEHRSGSWRVSIEPTEVDLRVGELRHRASHDLLTGLANREAFLAALEASVETSRPGKGPSVFLVDLDDFKSVNDSFGHDIGDELLTEIARRLRITSRPMDTVARLGGDEFVVLCDGVGDRGIANRIADRIVAALGTVVDVAGLQLTTSVSVGVAVGSPGVDAEELLRRADVAMFRAKDSPLAVAAYVDEAVPDERVITARQMRDVVRRGAFDVRWETIWRVADREPVGVRPIAFHRLAGGEEMLLSDLLVKIGDPALKAAAGRRVIERAVAEIAGHPTGGVRLHLPLRANEVLDFGVVGMLTQIIARSGIDPAAVVLEIAGDLLGRRATDVALPGLHDAGVRLAVEGFAAGRSGLALLQARAADLLRLDPALVRDIETDESRRRTLAALIDLAHANDMGALATGVATAEQLAMLVMLECDLAEGPLFGPAEPLLAGDG